MTQDENSMSEHYDTKGEFKKISINFHSQDRKVRKQCYIDLQKCLTNFDGDNDFCYNLFTESYMYIFNGMRDKAETVREQAISFIKFFIVDTLPLNDYYLTYTFPVIIERIGTVELVEESEELRLQLVQLLEAIIDKYAGHPDMFKQFLQDCITILCQSALDKHPSVKELCCKTIVKLAKALSQDFHLQAESSIKPVLTCLKHQRYKVRNEAILAIGEIIMHSTYKGVDEVMVPLAERLFDQVPVVRQTISRITARWLMEHRDRYSFWHKMMPLLLTGLNDEVEETRNEAFSLWEKVGLQYQTENEKDLKDQLDYLTELPKYYPDKWRRPNLGCRTLVQRNASKLAPAISRELTSWQEDIRLRCSQLLCAIALHAEDGLTFNLQDLLPAMYSTARDEDRRVVDNVVRACEIIGFFVKYETWSQLVLPTIEDGPHFGHLTVLAGLINGSPKEYISVHVEEISGALADDFVCNSRRQKYQTELLKCVRALVAKCDTHISKENSTGYNLFKIVMTLLALRDTTNEMLNTQLLIELSHSLNFKDYKHGLLVKYTETLLGHVRKNTPQSWTTVSDHACIFLTILLEADEAFGHNLVVIGDVLVEIFDGDTDPEMRLKTFYVLSTVFERKEVVFKEAGTELSNFLVRMITDVFVPSLVWHAGATAEAIRTMAATCLQYALTPQDIVELFGSADILRPLVDTLLPLLLSLIEDASYRSRQVAIECLTCVKWQCCRNNVWGNEDLIRIYPEFLKRLDDPTEKVRMTVLKNIPDLFQDVPSDFLLVNFKGHHELIFDTLLTHFDDDDQNIRNIVEDILKRVAYINKEVCIHKLERHKPLLHNQKGCDDTIHYIQNEM